MTYDSGRRSVVLFGGATYFSAGSWCQTGGDSPYWVCNDTWEWNGTNWSLQSPAMNNPSARQGSAISYDATHAVSVLFGGAQTESMNGSIPHVTATFADTWLWNGTTWASAVGDGRLTSEPGVNSPCDRRN